MLLLLMRKKCCNGIFQQTLITSSEISSLPSMPDDKGHLILYSRELVKIDEVSYSEKMQSSLLSGYEGVALEKINPDNKSEETKNWHSASESSGWGTPGAPNSVCSEMPVTSDMVNLSSSRITPDDDGFEDMLVIDFNLTGTAMLFQSQFSMNQEALSGRSQKICMPDRRHH